MRLRTLILLAIASSLAGGTAALVRSFLAKKTAEVETEPPARAAARRRMRAAMSFAPHLVPLAGSAGLMAMTAFEDFRRLIIPNAVPVGL
jgi:hypothetical protein